MENNQNKNLWIWVVVVLVIIVAFWFMIQSSTTVVTDNTVNNPAVNTEDTALEANIGMEDISAGSVNAGATAVSISYANALIKYKDTRLQLDKTCQASPNNVTYKNGTNIMIDNRAPVARTVKVGSTFSIKAWGFKIVKISSPTLPATWLVDCGTSQNVATILIQK